MVKYIHDIECTVLAKGYGETENKKIILGVKF